MTKPVGRRIAANPIPYWSRGGRIDKSPAVFDEAFADFAHIGFTAECRLPVRVARISYEWAATTCRSAADPAQCKASARKAHASFCMAASKLCPPGMKFPR